ncbi:hypothetical protein HDU76_008087 [Blyttiomyces sp. JEL0837]|nr:hypothetical protein HDU76_008087 [Blyttiomyces sp. JEL0837]
MFQSRYLTPLLKRRSTLLIGGAILALGSTELTILNYMINRADPSPSSYLHKYKSKHLNSDDYIDDIQTPIFVDSFEMRLLRPLRSSPSKDSTTTTTNLDPIDKILSAFIHCPIFTLERFILKYTGMVVNPSDNIIKQRYNVGDKMAAWEVIEKNSNQVLLKWKFPGWGLNGVTWISVGDIDGGTKKSSEDIDGMVVGKADVDDDMVRFGSGLVGVKGGSNIGFGWRVILHMHYFYSRVILANTVFTMRVLE